MSIAKGKGVKKNLAKVVGDSLRHLYGSLQRGQHSPSLRIIYNDGNGGTLETKETIQANQVNDIDNGNQVRENLLNQITGMLTEKINLTKVNIIKGSGKKNDDANRIVLKVAESLLKQIEGLKGDTKKEEEKKYVGDVEFADKYGEDKVEKSESTPRTKISNK